MRGNYYLLLIKVNEEIFFDFPKISLKNSSKMAVIIQFYLKQIQHIIFERRK